MGKKKKKMKKLRKWKKLPEKKRKELQEAKKIGRGVEVNEVKEGVQDILGKEAFEKMETKEAVKKAVEKADKRIEELHKKGVINDKMKKNLKVGSGEEEIVKFKKVLEKL